jgi:hypothetical protein
MSRRSNGVVIPLIIAVIILIAAGAARAQSPEGGAKAPNGPSPYNLIVSLSTNTKSGKPEITTSRTFGDGFVPCNTVVSDGSVIPCGEVASIVRGKDKNGRRVWAIKFTPAEKIAAIYYDYAKLDGSGNISCHPDWKAPFKRAFLRKTKRGDKICGYTGPAAKLDFLQVKLYDSNFPSYSPPPPPESEGMAGPA